MSRIKDTHGPTIESPVLAQRARLRTMAQHWLDTGELPQEDGFDQRLLWAEVRMIHRELTRGEELEDARGRLERAQARYAKLFDLVPAGILVTTLTGRIQESNAHFAALVGLARTFTQDRAVSSFVDAEDEAALNEHLLASFGGEQRTCQLHLITQDTTKLPVRISSIRGEDEHGQPVLLNVILDISADLADARKRQQIARMETVSQLTGGIAQEFNNLLTAMLGATDLLGSFLDDDLEASAVVEHIEKIVRRGTDLTQQLLTFAQRRAILPRPVDLDRHLQQQVVGLKRSLPDTISLRLDLQTRGRLTLIDPAALDSALAHLIHNARDAMESGGVIVLSTALGAHEEDTAPDTILLRVQDTGSGIARDHISRVFDPFFTTKEVGKGTGLGLSMVKGFVEQARGTIEARSTQGRGTTIAITLPIYTSPEQPSRAPHAYVPGAARPGTPRRILLVEDNEFVRRVTARHLTRWGMEVVQVENGDDALPLIDSQRFDAIITDMVMPGQTSGTGIVIHARQRLGAIPILITTGYADNDLLEEDGLEQNETLRVLSKPYDSAALEAQLNQLLGISSGADHGKP
jgi:PAS domain S-box-containing protein